MVHSMAGVNTSYNQFGISPDPRRALGNRSNGNEAETQENKKGVNRGFKLTGKGRSGLCKEGARTIY
jgi:hypothetical protein